jgi:hypothetical protein
LAKFNVWQKRPKTRTAQTKTFQDIDEDSGEPDGEPFDLTFWRLTDPEESYTAEEFVAMRARLSEPTRREIALFMNSVKKKKQADDVIPEGTSV